MIERDGYPPGVPCWVDTSQPDPDAAVDFYRELFGWEFTDRMPPGSEGSYYVAKLHGKQVTAVSSQPEGSPPTPNWATYIWVENADETAAKAKEAGGSVLVDPFDIFEAGRMAVLSDPTGAVFCLWEAGTHRGAELVNAGKHLELERPEHPRPGGGQGVLRRGVRLGGAGASICGTWAWPSCG